MPLRKSESPPPLARGRAEDGSLDDWTLQYRGKSKRSQSLAIRTGDNNPVTYFRDMAPGVLANGYRPLPIQPGEKRPRPELNGWSRYCGNAPDNETFKTWLRAYGSSGVGIACGNVAGVDIDVLDPAVAAEIKDAIVRRLGQAPERTGLPPKTLLLYRATQPFAKKPIKKFALPGFTPADGQKNEHGAEILANGAQFVAFHIHPDTGLPYSWANGDPTSTNIDDLPTITPEQAEWAYNEAYRILISHGATPIEKSTPIGNGASVPVSERPAKDAEDLKGDPEEIAAALRYIPSDCSRGEWVRIGQAIKNALDDAGEPIFVEWSTSSERYRDNGVQAEETYRTFRIDAQRDARGRAGAATIFAAAKKNGWQGTRARSSAEEDFNGKLATSGKAEAKDAPALPVVQKKRPAPQPIELLGDEAPGEYPDPLVEGLIDEGAAVLLIGAPKAGKSHAAYAIAHAVATGRPLAGRHVEAGGVLYVQYEGFAGMRSRRAALRAKHGTAGALAFWKATGNILHAEHQELIVVQIEEAERRLGRRISLIVVDTLSAAAPGLDQNKAAEVSKALEGFKARVLRDDRALLLIHHTPKNGDDPAGSFVFKANVDGVLRVEKMAGGVRKLVAADMRDHAEGNDLEFRLESVRVGTTRRGRAVESAVALFGAAGEFAPVDDGMTPGIRSVQAAIRSLLEHAPTAANGSQSLRRSEIVWAVSMGDSMGGAISRDAANKRVMDWWEVHGRKSGVNEAGPKNRKVLVFPPMWEVMGGS
jgi:KaiC/GvpD/RAD55 family RecA-like ATPase